MKAAYYSILVILFSGLMACESYLDKLEDKPLDLESVFKKRTTTEQYLWNVYSYIPTTTINGSLNTSVSDEAIFCFVGFGSESVNNGSWSTSSAPGAMWAHYYQGIREANIFMDALQKKKWCPEEVISFKEQTKMANEARFLRAYYYSQLMIQYGPVILMGDELMDLTAPDIASLERERSSWDDCIAYVTAELDAVVPLLDVTPDRQWYGKPTQGAAKAVKARLLLYSARDLFNGNPDFRQSKLFPASQQSVKWEDAAKANWAVIQMGLYTLVEKQREVNGQTEVDPYESLYALIAEPWNDELIWARRIGWGPVQTLCIPAGVGGPTSFGGISATQQMVDAYAMGNGIYPVEGYGSDGAPIFTSRNSGYSESGFTEFTHPIEGDQSRTFNMYIKREPRFYSHIFWNGAKWVNGCTSKPDLRLEFFKGGNSGYGGGNDYSKGGYMVRKFTDKSRDHSLNNMDNWGVITIPIVRLGEIYLNYVEALIESDPGNADILTYWNLIRRRAGVPAIETVYSDVTGNQELMRTLIRRERQVELAFEGHRYPDLRTWKKGKECLGGPMYGMNYLAKDGKEDGEFWKRSVVEYRIFKNNHYLYPMSQREMDRNKKLEQNPGW